MLCRTLEQAEAALDAGADGVYLDFLELTGTGDARARAPRARRRHVSVAPPRIRKPGEEKIDRYLASLAPDAILVRGLGALRDGAATGVPRIGDFSLNVTNRLTRGRGARRAGSPRSRRRSISTPRSSTALPRRRRSAPSPRWSCTTRCRSSTWSTA